MKKLGFLIVGIIVLALVALVGLAFLYRYNLQSRDATYPKPGIPETPLEAERDASPSQQVDSVPAKDYMPGEGEFSAYPGTGSLKNILTIPSSVEISSHCPICLEEGIDFIEGQGWEYSLSKDLSQSAYMASKNGKEFVVLNGVAQPFYDRVYFLKFSPDGKRFSYHAYDEKREETYLVVNGKEIPIYSGPEGYPQAANGVSEAFSNDGRLAYAQVTKEEPGNINIFVEEKLVNSVQGELIRLWFTGDEKHIEYVVLTREIGERKDHFYRDDKLVNDSVSYNDFLMDPAGNLKVLTRGIPIYNNNLEKTISIGLKKIADYSKFMPEVYFSNMTVDAAKKNVAYTVWDNKLEQTVWLALNGHDVKEKFNGIQGIQFAEDGREISYLGRRGRSIYFVTHDIQNQ